MEAQGLRSDMLMFLETEEAELRRRQARLQVRVPGFHPSQPDAGAPWRLRSWQPGKLCGQKADPGNPAEPASEDSVAKTSVGAPAQVT